MKHLDLFGEDGGRNPHCLDWENWWVQVEAFDENSKDQND